MTRARVPKDFLRDPLRSERLDKAQTGRIFPVDSTIENPAVFSQLLYHPEVLATIMMSWGLSLEVEMIELGPSAACCLRT